MGSGPNAASPHHEPGARVIGPGETVVCDFGGTYSLDGDVGYCSDITRTVVTGPPTGEVEECYGVLRAAQQAAVASARSGVTAEHVDHVARTDHRGRRIRRLLRPPHRARDRHRGARGPLPGGRATTSACGPGHAFSVEPGIYLPGRFGMRLEDIVVIGEDGDPEPLNSADHGLVVVDV